MSLATYDVKQELVKLTQNFFSIDHQFSELKNLLTDKKTIPWIHNQIVDQLSQIKKSDEIAMIARLEKSAYEQQMKEDDDEKNRDVEELRQDLLRRNDLTRQLEILRVRKEQYERELLIRNTVPHVHTHPDTPVIHQHPSQPISAPLLNPNNHVHTHLEATLSSQDIELSIQKINRRISEINKELEILDSRNNAREIRRGDREKRLQARLNYVQKTAGVVNTLSPDNQKKLLSNIEKEKKSLTQQHSSLLLKADQLNYSIFLQQFELSLQSMQRPFQEADALKAIVKRMKEHLNYKEKAASIQSRLDNTVLTIGENLRRLTRLNTQLSSLQLANPDLTRRNERLEEQNRELLESYNSHIKTRNKLFFPTLVLSGLSLLFSIPLILTLTGIIPYAIAPAVLLTLVIAPPALLLLAGLGVGIATIIYAVKAYFNNSTIESNQETIESNRRQMGANQKEIYTLENQTIPNLKKELLENEEIKNRLTDELQYIENLAEQALKQANEVEPYVYSAMPFFNPEVVVHQHPSVGNGIVTPSAPPIDPLYPAVRH
ncbi:TPA: Dot/Icm T4SS effector PpeB [Legionella pneumophila]|uniref:Dot/Icm T4SS effector PpeB n=1 Tax=Legionella pneumophila TaxID=446 RepID=A0AAP3HGP0_LEGPN|nr:Dot/Icm T4SS effector PpeB [Legionella pneumophila]ANH13060.1 type IV secretion protein Dot [Legionella pneumophila]ANH16027.1 type IV secretion protein Dot [Legionella pneumophila]ANH18993.1 type IV secretion protein Dot [Legionella pneumophila]APX19881.1 type IV secretion protein Dot [Legionella pneumophila]AQL12057.1 type IV secretion protein Dot [Legionella pneumophila]